MLLPVLKGDSGVALKFILFQLRKEFKEIIIIRFFKRS